VLVALATRRLPALVTGGFNWVDARDVVAEAIRAAERAPSGARYVLAGHWVAVRDLAAAVEAITGVRAPRLVAPMWLARIGAPFLAAGASVAGRRPLYTAVSLQALRGYRHVSHARATRDLGYQPRPFPETILDTLRWFAANGQLDHPLPFPTLETSAWMDTYSTTRSSSVSSPWRR
jgi:dihydroflavonol-4-reductase